MEVAQIPPLKGEGQRHHCAEQSFREGDLRHHVGEVETGHTVAESYDSTHHGHQQQRDQLDDGGGDGKPPRQPRGQRVHGVGDDHEHPRQHHGAAAYHRILPAHQHAEIAGGQPTEHRHQRGVVDDRHEPSHIVAVGPSAGGPGVAHQPLHVLMALGHHAEGAGADDHHHAHNNESQNAHGQIAAGLCQHRLRLEEHAGADDRAHHQRDGNRQRIPFFHIDFPFSPVSLVPKSQ